jgi:hypothetical protein
MSLWDHFTQMIKWISKIKHERAALLEVIRALAFIWVAKLGVLAAGESLPIVVSCWVMGSYSMWKLLRACSAGIGGRLMCLALVSAGLFAPYFSDTLWAFHTETGFLTAFSLTVIAWIFVGTLCLCLRAPLIFLKSPLVSFSYCLLVPLLELSLLFLFPLAHFGSLPAPVPVAEQHKTDPVVGTLNSEIWVFIDPRWDEDARRRAAVSAESGVFEAPEWGFLQSRIPDLVGNFPSLGGRLTVFFPETALAFGPAGVRSLYDHLETSLSEAVAAIGRERPPELVLVAGVGSALENRVVMVRRSEMTRRLEISGLAEKKVSVPFFERDVLGFSVYRRRSGADQESNAVPGESLWFDLRPSVLSLGGGSDLAVSICYEALFPQLAVSDGLRLVFTNTHIFSRYRLAALTYTYTLRLSAVLRSETILLVSNFGDSGLFGHREREAGEQAPSFVFLQAM